MYRLYVLALLACGATAAAPRSPPTNTSTNPCFPDAPALDAHAMWKALEKYSWSVYQSADEPPPPPTTYGTCKVEHNRVTTSRGALVAELGCGVRVLVPGIHDGLGLALGASGQDVLARTPVTTALTCYANGPDQARCQFARPADTDTDLDAYVVAGAITGEVITGEAARAFFATRRIVELHVSIWCH